MGEGSTNAFQGSAAGPFKKPVGTPIRTPFAGRWQKQGQTIGAGVPIRMPFEGWQQQAKLEVKLERAHASLNGNRTTSADTAVPQKVGPSASVHPFPARSSRSDDRARPCSAQR
jgi:hypothetical protein